MSSVGYLKDATPTIWLSKNSGPPVSPLAIHWGTTSPDVASMNALGRIWIQKNVLGSSENYERAHHGAGPEPVIGGRWDHAHPVVLIARQRTAHDDCARR